MDKTFNGQSWFKVWIACLDSMIIPSLQLDPALQDIVQILPLTPSFIIGKGLTHCIMKIDESHAPMIGDLEPVFPDLSIPACSCGRSISGTRT